MHRHESTSLLLLELLFGQLLLETKLQSLFPGLLVLNLHLFDHLSANVVLDHVDQPMSSQPRNLFSVHRAYVFNQVFILADHDSLAPVVLVLLILIKLFVHNFQAFDVAQVLRGHLTFALQSLELLMRRIQRINRLVLRLLYPSEHNRNVRAEPSLFSSTIPVLILDLSRGVALAGLPKVSLVLPLKHGLLNLQLCTVVSNARPSLLGGLLGFFLHVGEVATHSLVFLLEKVLQLVLFRDLGDAVVPSLPEILINVQKHLW